MTKKKFNEVYNKIYDKYHKKFIKYVTDIKRKININEPNEFIRSITYREYVSDERYNLYKQFTHELLFKLFSKFND